PPAAPVGRLAVEQAGRGGGHGCVSSLVGSASARRRRRLRGWRGGAVFSLAVGGVASLVTASCRPSGPSGPSGQTASASFPDGWSGGPPMGPTIGTDWGTIGGPQSCPDGWSPPPTACSLSPAPTWSSALSRWSASFSSSASGFRFTPGTVRFAPL